MIINSVRKSAKILSQRICCRWLSNKNEIEYSSNVKYGMKIFSGIQPTGNLHIGNYLGAIRQWIDLQNRKEDVIYFIADLHSITMPQEPAKLRENTLIMISSLLACGIDPDKATLFLQSSVRAHTELCWILGTLTTMARLAHLPQYKEKTEKLKDIPLGLFVYPVLQAADILLYKSTHVPVGEDQVQQLQLAQHLAKLFNHKYSDTFPIPHAIVTKDDYTSRIRSLRQPEKKMSKSDPDPKSCLMITDPPALMTDKIKKSITDFTSEVFYDPEKRPGVSNLLSIHSAVCGKTINEICENSKNLNTGQYKLIVAETLIEHFNPIRIKIEDYLKNPDYLWNIIEKGNIKANEIAEKTLKDVKMKIGIGRAML